MSAPLRILIVDDEPLARTLLRVLLEPLPGVRVVAECSGPEAVAEVERWRPDVMFLDVQMPEVDGFEVLAQLGPERSPVVVFVTAYDQYALKAFEVHAVDYLLKPVGAERFRQALDYAKTRVRSRAEGTAEPAIAALLGERSPFPSRLLVPERERTLVIDVAAIDWIEAADYYASIHVGARTHLLRRTLTELEGRLDPTRFFRVHRSAIVSLERVREIHPMFHGDSTLVLSTGAQVRLSRARRAEFERLFAAVHRVP